MRKVFILAAACLMSSLLSINAFAMEIGKPVVTTLPLQTGQTQAINAGKKEVYLMGIQLSEKEQARLLNFKNKLLASASSLNFKNPSLPSTMNLGMNGVPVLDQGHHGTCVTFATTAAVDAAIGKGDYISQLCQLELGSFLEKDSYMTSGWDGSYGPWTIDQMFRFGIINKQNQHKQSCAGVKEYPTNNSDFQGKPMSQTDYKSMSESLYNWGLYPVYLLSSQDRDSEHYSLDDAKENVRKVKEALSRGDRVTFGGLLFELANCGAGACGKHHVSDDTWVITKELYNDDGVRLLGGHEMVIYGYDDNAVAIDHDGKQHQGLFMLRNSWSNEVGDKGDFYMSYDYFILAVDEVQVIAKLQDD